MTSSSHSGVKSQKSKKCKLWCFSTQQNCVHVVYTHYANAPYVYKTEWFQKQIHVLKKVQNNERYGPIRCHFTSRLPRTTSKSSSGKVLSTSWVFKAELYTKCTKITQYITKILSWFINQLHSVHHKNSYTVTIITIIPTKHFNWFVYFILFL